jgi:hypothetical protein
MAWTDAARAAALAVRRAHSMKTYGTNSRHHAALALKKARSMTKGMGKHRSLITKRYAYQMLKSR